MKKIIGLAVLVLVSVLGYSQDLDTLMVDSLAMDSLLQDSIKEPPPYYAAIYLTAEARFSPHYTGYNYSSGLGIGAQYNRWLVGFSIFEFGGIVEEFVIFPNVFELDYRYGGPTFGYELFDNQLVSMDLNASVHYGDMVWRTVESNDDFLRDKFYMATGSCKIDYDEFRYIKPFFRVGYQRAMGLDLERVNSTDFTGFVFGFGLHIGYFNQ